jgi:hypothetical protein
MPIEDSSANHSDEEKQEKAEKEKKMNLKDSSRFKLHSLKEDTKELLLFHIKFQNLDGLISQIPKSPK